MDSKWKDGSGRMDSWKDRCLKKKQRQSLEWEDFPHGPQFCCLQLLEKDVPGGRALHVCLFFPFGQDTLTAVPWLQSGEGSPGHIKLQEGSRNISSFQLT